MAQPYVTDVVNAIVKIMNGPITSAFPNGIWPYIATHVQVNIEGEETPLDPLNLQNAVSGESGIECFPTFQDLNMWLGCYASAAITNLSGLAGAKINTSVPPQVAYTCAGANPSLTITLQATANVTASTQFEIQFGPDILFVGCLETSGGPSLSSGITVDLVFVIPVTLTSSQVTFEFGSMSFQVNNPQNITLVNEIENDIQIAADALTLGIMAIPGVWDDTLGSLVNDLNDYLYGEIASVLASIPSDTITSALTLSSMTLNISESGWPCCAPTYSMCGTNCCDASTSCFNGACCTPQCDGSTCGNSDQCGGTCGCSTSPYPQTCVNGQCVSASGFCCYAVEDSLSSPRECNSSSQSMCVAIGQENDNQAWWFPASEESTCQNCASWLYQPRRNQHFF